MLRARVLGVIAIVVCATAAPAAAASPSTITALPRAWRVRVGPSAAVAMPVLYRGRAFTNDSSRISAVSVVTGTVSWHTHHTYEIYGGVDLGAPSLVNGTIDTPWSFTRYGGVVESDPRTGAFTQSNTGSLTIGHVVMYRGEEATLHASFVPTSWIVTLDYGGAKPGGVAFTNGSLGPYADPVFAGSTHVWVGFTDSLQRFDPKGRCVPAPDAAPFCAANAAVPLPGNIVGLAAGPGHTVVVTTDDGSLQVLDGLHGQTVWSATLGATPTAPAVLGDTIVVGSSSGTVVAYAAAGCGGATCQPVWTSDLGVPITTAPAFGNGNVFVATADGWIAQLAAAGCGAASCRPLAIGRTGATSAITSGPVVGEGDVVVGTGDGHLVAFREP
jgi:outer membrane protein assembly factor BamB